MILAAGGHARVVAETALASGYAASIAFLDDRPLTSVLGWPVIGPLSLAYEPSIKDRFSSAFVGIGDAALRLRWIDRLKLIGYTLPVLVHPTSWVSPSAQLGPCTAVFAQSAVQAQADIGCGVIINTGCSVDHQVLLGDGVHVCPGARLAGDVQVGSCTWIGIGSCVKQSITIGSDVTVGAGAAVVCNVPNKVTVVGVPARVASSS